MSMVLKILKITCGILVGITLILMASFFIFDFSEQTSGDLSFQEQGGVLTINDRPVVIDQERRLALFPLSQESIGKKLVLYIRYTLSDETLVYRGKEIKSDTIIQIDKPHFAQKLQFSWKNSGLSFDLVFTNLPVIQIEAPTMIDLFKMPGKFILTAPHPEESTRWLPIGIEIRGLTSRFLPKNGYSIQLGSAGDWQKGRDLSLLSMRSDDDWILSGEHRDRSLSRNLIAHQLFDLLYSPHHTSYGLKGKPTEVFLNGQYSGIYVLSQRIDRKSMGLPKNKYGEKTETHRLYKYFRDHQNHFKYLSEEKTQLKPYYRAMRAISQAMADGTQLFHSLWENPPAQHLVFNCSRYLMALNEGKNFSVNGTRWQSRCEQKIPNFETLNNWKMIKELHRATFFADDQEFVQFVAKHFEEKNLIDYWIMLQLTGAADNHGKNFYLWIDPQQTIRFLPWDIDASFGFGYDGRKIEESTRTYRLEGNGFYHRLSMIADWQFERKLALRWQELRKAGLSSKSIQLIFGERKEQLKRSGALERNYLRWYEGQDGDDLGNFRYMEKWIEERVKYLDERWGKGSVS